MKREKMILTKPRLTPRPKGCAKHGIKKCRDCIRESQRITANRKYHEDIEKGRAQARARQKRIAQLYKERRYNNPAVHEAALESHRAFLRANPWWPSYYTSLRALIKTRATPPWVDREALKAVYKEARSLGKNFEVDHIVPLKHPRVCGLHVPWNLQVLSVSENRRKHNRFEEE